MRTLLSLFFVPYLRFLLKFHLYAIPVGVLIFLVGVPELMMLVPMIYMFSLYATMNRHQFKENIPWMLATFNKRTLVRYHFLAQTLVLLCQAALSGLMMVGFFMAMILVAPESSDQVLPDLASGVAGKGAGSVITKAVSPLASTKEQLLLTVVLVFFLITMYSPVSLKDYLRQMEERRGQKGKWAHALQVLAFVALGGSIYLLDPSKWLGPLLSFILVAEIAYVIWIFNRAFALFHPRHYPKGLMVAGVGVLLVGTSVQQISSYRFQHDVRAEVRLGELSFMGAMAPQLSVEQFTAIAREVKDPMFILDLVEEPRFARMMDSNLVLKWALEAKELGVALRLIKTLPKDKLQGLQQASVWAHLGKLHKELNERNPASASWQLKTFQRHLAKHEWKPIHSHESWSDLEMALFKSERLPASAP